MQSRFGVVCRNSGRLSGRGDYRLKRNGLAFCVSRKQVRCLASTARPKRPEVRPTMPNRPTGQNRVMITQKTTQPAQQPTQTLEKPTPQSSGSQQPFPPPQSSSPPPPPPPPPPAPPQQQSPGLQRPQPLQGQNLRNPMQNNIRGPPGVGQPNNNFVTRPQQQYPQQQQQQQPRPSPTPPPTFEGNRQQRPPPGSYNQAALKNQTKGPKVMKRVVMSASSMQAGQQFQQLQPQQQQQQQPGAQNPSLLDVGGSLPQSPQGGPPQAPPGQIQRQMGGQTRQLPSQQNNQFIQKSLSSMGGAPGPQQTGMGGPPGVGQPGRPPMQPISRQLGGIQQESRATQDLMAKFGQGGGAQINQQQRISHTQLRSQGNVAFRTQIGQTQTGATTLPTKPPGVGVGPPQLNQTGVNQGQQPQSGVVSTQAGANIEQLLAQAGQKNKDISGKMSAPQARVQSRQGTTLHPFNNRPAPITPPSPPPLRQPPGQPAAMQTRSPQEILQTLQSPNLSPPAANPQIQVQARSSVIAPPGMQRPGVVPQVPGQMQRPGGMQQQAPVQQQIVSAPAPTIPVQAPVERPLQKDVSRKPIVTPMAEPDPSISYPKSYPSKDRLLPVNEDIRTPMVRLVSADQQQLGILPTEEAMALAQDQEMDLLLINQEAKPPVAKLFKYDKYKFEKEKAEKETKKKQRLQQVDTKEVKLKPNTDVHDYDVKIKNAKKFLSKGDKVKVTLRFRGREIQFKEVADEMLQRFVSDVEDLATVESGPTLRGNNLVMMLTPTGKK